MTPESTDDTIPTNMPAPAALSEALQQRLLNAMQTAQKEEQEFRDLEEKLKTLSPAPMSPFAEGRMGVRMYLAAGEYRKQRASVPSYFSRQVAAVAALALCCMGGGFALYNGSAVADTESQGMVSRNVLETKLTEELKWDSDSAPVRCYEVLYEDSFTLEADDDMSVSVRVPNRTQVMIPVDML